MSIDENTKKYTTGDLSVIVNQSFDIIIQEIIRLKNGWMDEKRINLQLRIDIENLKNSDALLGDARYIVRKMARAEQNFKHIQSELSDAQAELMKRDITIKNMNQENSLLKDQIDKLMNEMVIMAGNKIENDAITENV